MQIYKLSTVVDYTEIRMKSGALNLPGRRLTETRVLKTRRRELAQDLLAGYVSGPDVTLQATAQALATVPIKDARRLLRIKAISRNKYPFTISAGAPWARFTRLDEKVNSSI